jgi:hypothetical protein
MCHLLSSEHFSSASSACGGASVLGPQKGSVTAANQEFGVDERIQHGIARGTIQAPQPLRLRRRQAKSGHFEVFALNTPKDVLEWLMLCCHSSMLPCAPEMTPARRRWIAKPCRRLFAAQPIRFGSASAHV